VEEAARGEDSLDHHLQLGQVVIGRSFAADRAPGFEPLAAGGERADACCNPVGAYEHRVGCEQHRQAQDVS